MSVGTAAHGDDSVEDLASVTAFAGPQREEFDRLRHRLQLTNLRIARLYFLVKEQGAEEPEAETQTAVEELFISDSEFQAHLGVLCEARGGAL